MDQLDGEIRSFIALELPSEVKGFLAKVTEDLKKTGADVKWVRPEGMHLTLKFLGEIPAPSVPAIREQLSPEFARQKPFELHVSGLGAFPDLKRPRVVWAGLKDPLNLIGPLATRVDGLLEPLGFRREKRPFNAHLTLGRVRSLKKSTELVDSLRQAFDLSGPTFPVDHAVLFRSILRPTGAEYHSLCRFNFAGA